MQTRNRTAVATEAAAQAALRRGAAPALTAEEERATRMRLGAPLPRGAALERKAAPRSELELELLAMEVEGFLRWKEHLARVRAAPAAPATTSSRTKEKIVRALRRKV
jgi:hypothetical protein